MGWQLKYFLFSPRKFGEDEPILTCAYFSDGLVKNHQPVMVMMVGELKRDPNSKGLFVCDLHGSGIKFGENTDSANG